MLAFSFPEALAQLRAAPAFAFLLAHWASLLFGLFLLATILNKLLPGHPALSGLARQAVSILAFSPMAGARSAFFAFVASKLGDGAAAALFDWLSKWLDLPLLSKSVQPPGQLIELQSPRGYARLGVLAFLLAVALLGSAAAAAASPPNPEALAGAVAQDPAAVQPDPTAPPPPRRFGGCVRKGTVCFQPTVALTSAALNLSTRKVEGAFSPGVGVGVTFYPGKWSSFGVDAYFTLDPAAQKASAALLFKFLNGYGRVGVSKGLLGDLSWRIPLAFGIDL